MKNDVKVLIMTAFEIDQEMLRQVYNLVLVRIISAKTKPGLVRIIGLEQKCRHFCLHIQGYLLKLSELCLIMKLFQCRTCHSILRYEADKEEHSKVGVSHQGFNEYELEEFLTRFLVTA